MIIYRYLSKEVLLTMLSSTIVLLLIFMSTQFIHYLSAAAIGKYSAGILIHIMLLQVPYLLGLLMPAGLFLAILLAYGRLTNDREMVVLTSCGFSQIQLMKVTLSLGLAVAIIVAILNLWVGPIIAGKQKQIINQAKNAPMIETILPGRFFASDNGKQVLYIESISRDHTRMHMIFLAERENNPRLENWSVLVAKDGSEQIDNAGNHLIVINQGQRYSGIPGENNFQIEKFENYIIRLSQAVPPMHTDEQTMSTFNLVKQIRHNPNAEAEWQWRLSMPISTLILALLAIPLSNTNPRQGRFSQLLPAIIIYIFYANMMFLVRSWLQAEIIPAWLGTWWLHLFIIGIAVSLFAVQGRWYARFKMRAAT